MEESFEQILNRSALQFKDFERRINQYLRPSTSFSSCNNGNEALTVDTSLMQSPTKYGRDVTIDGVMTNRNNQSNTIPSNSKSSCLLFSKMKKESFERHQNLSAMQFDDSELNLIQLIVYDALPCVGAAYSHNRKTIVSYTPLPPQRGFRKMRRKLICILNVTSYIHESKDSFEKVDALSINSL